MSGAWGDDMMDFDRDDREPAREMMAEDSKPVITEAMIDAGVQNAHGKDWGEIVVNCYRAMLAAAPVNAMSGEEPKTITCEACEGPVEYDLLVSDDLWAKIAPRQVDGWKGGGVLCPSCILDRSIVVAATPRPSELVAAMRKALKAISIFDGAAYELRNMAADALHDSLTTEGQAAGVEDGWRNEPLPEHPRQSMWVDVRQVTTFRYLPYKPAGRKQMAKPGRWQRANDYGWENAARPEGEWKPNLPLPAPALTEEQG